MSCRNLWMLFVIIAGSPSPCFGQLAPSSQLYFPSDRTVGTIETRPQNSELGWRDMHTGWTMLADAKGMVSVPEGQEALLEVSPSAADDLSFLEELHPDGLFALRLRNCDVGDSQTTHVAHLTGLSWLYIRNTRITGQGIQHLSPLINLKYLEYNAHYSDRSGKVDRNLAPSRLGEQLVMHGLDDQSVQALNAFPQLEYLSLSMSPISYRALLTLSQLRQLRCLNIQSIDAEHRGLELLSNLKQLEFLSIGSSWGGSKINDLGAQKIANVRSLTSLSLNGAQITHEGLAALAQLPHLESLSINDVNVAPADLAALSSAPSLKRLQAGWRHSQWREYGPALAQIKSLEEVGQVMTVDPASLRAILTLPKLKRLSVLGTGMDAFHGIGEDFAKCQTLQRIDLQQISIEDEDLQAICKLKNLEDLGLLGTSISGPGLQALDGLPNLEVFSLSESKVGPIDLQHLPALPRLKHLNLYDCQLPFDLDWYRRLETLQYANLGSLRVAFYAPAVRDEHLAGIRRWQALQTLDMSEVAAISDRGLSEIVQLQKLQYLSVAGALTPKGLQVLKELPQLRSLSIASPYFGSDDIEQLQATLGNTAVSVYGGNRCKFPGLADGLLRCSCDRRLEQDRLEGQPIPEGQVSQWFDDEQQPSSWQGFAGKIVLLNLQTPASATGDVARRQLLSGLYSKYHDRAFEIITLLKAQDHETVAAYILDTKPAWHVGLDKDGRTADWLLDKRDGYHLVDRNGLLRVVNLAEEDIERALQQLLDQ